MAVVTFNKAAFLARYPEFNATVALYTTADIAQMCFDEAGLYCDNRDCSRIPIPPRDTLLNMMTAHIMALNFGVNGQPATQAVGRVSSAGEGSVNVSLEMGTPTNDKAWYMQTKYGAAFWQASKGYRSALYIPPDDSPTQIFLREG